MKEATGELNMTVIVVISVGILSAFFFTVLWPMIKANYQQEANCKNAVCDCKDYKENDYKCCCWEKGKEKGTCGPGGDGFYCPFGG